MKASEIRIRDPFVHPDPSTGIYYLYGTTRAGGEFGGGCGEPGFDVYTSRDLADFDGPFPIFRRPEGFWAVSDFWAPEMHVFNGGFHLFATMRGPDAESRGTVILRADSPLGPFAPWSDGPVTPRGWQCLDGTLHIDENGRPWIVFCHEWCQISDGGMCARPLNDDLSAPAGDAVTLFRGSDAPWAVARGEMKNIFITDGPFLFRLDGKLQMLWSGFGADGYVMGRAFSESGNVLGPWRQDPKPVFDRDGGHGMAFRDFGGTLRIALHSPNEIGKERPVFMTGAL